MRALDRKLLRDMKRLWAQSLAVALVMAAGVATMLIGLGAYYSLSETRTAYYDRTQFADVFAASLSGAGAAPAFSSSSKSCSSFLTAFWISLVSSSR